MQNPGHPLQEWDDGKSPLVSKDPAVVAELNGYYNVVNEALEEYRQKVREAEDLDKDLKPEARAERQHRILDKARQDLQSSIDKALQHYQAANEEIRQQVNEASKPVQPESEIQQLMQQMREQEIRAELKNMERTERAKLLLNTTKLGDRSILQACERSLTPMVDSTTLDSARNRYTEAVASDPLQRLQYAEHITKAAQVSAKLATGAIANQVDSQHDIQPRPQSMGKLNTDPDVTGMSAADKASFIGKHGHDKYMQVVTGKAQLSDFE
ncbi:MAG: hypothetical protein R6U55_10975 [Desulfovermiculus sp.]